MCRSHHTQILNTILTFPRHTIQQQIAVCSNAFPRNALSSVLYILRGPAGPVPRLHVHEPPICQSIHPMTEFVLGRTSCSSCSIDTETTNPNLLRLPAREPANTATTKLPTRALAVPMKGRNECLRECSRQRWCCALTDTPSFSPIATGHCSRASPELARDPGRGGIATTFCRRS